MRQELAVALLDHHPLGRARLPLAARRLERDQPERAAGLAVDLQRAGQRCRSAAAAATFAASSSASELPATRGCGAAFGVDLQRRRGHARRRALAEQRGDRGERLGADEQLGGREQLLGEVLVAARRARRCLLELVGGLAQSCAFSGPVRACQRAWAPAWARATDSAWAAAPAWVPEATATSAYSPFAGVAHDSASAPRAQASEVSMRMVVGIVRAGGGPESFRVGRNRSGVPRSIWSQSTKPVRAVGALTTSPTTRASAHAFAAVSSERPSTSRNAQIVANV